VAVVVGAGADWLLLQAPSADARPMASMPEKSVDCFMKGICFGE